MARILSLLLAALLSLTACGKEQTVFAPHAPTGEMQLEIQGGSVDRSNTAVVGLYVERDGGGSICSGSLIAPNLVLTAQHCIAQLPRDYVICGDTRFGNVFSNRNIYVTTNQDINQNARYYGVREVLVPQLFQDTCGNDIALLILDGAVPQGEASPMTPRLDSPPNRQERYTAVGFGHTGQGQGAGRRRFVQNKEIICTVDDCVRSNPNEIYAAEFVGNEGICRGDSGGPAIDEYGRVMGAASRGAQNCQYPIYSSVYAWADWIKEQALRASAIGGYSPPDWSEPPNLDADLDGYDDDFDNCEFISNPDQRDLDEDGLGDACDPSNDRECVVCEACNSNADCGAGAYCGTGGVCRMACLTNADCPGGDSTACRSLGQEKVCVNVNLSSAGLCPENYVCGQTPRDDVPETQPTPEDNRPRNGVGATETEGDSTAENNGEYSTQANSQAVDIEEATSRPVAGRAQITFEHCDVMPDRSPPGASFLMWTVLLGIGAFRRRRWRLEPYVKAD